MTNATTDRPATPLEVLARGRNIGIVHATRGFAFDHLPDHLQRVSAPFSRAACELLEAIPSDDPEVTVALRKLMEAKDAAVRAAVFTAGGAR